MAAATVIHGSKHLNMIAYINILPKPGSSGKFARCLPSVVSSSLASKAPELSQLTNQTNMITKSKKPKKKFGKHGNYHVRITTILHHQKKLSRNMACSTIYFMDKNNLQCNFYQIYVAFTGLLVLRQSTPSTQRPLQTVPLLINLLHQYFSVLL